MRYKQRIQLYLQFYHERGINDGIFLRDVRYKQLDYAIRGKLNTEAQRQARTTLLPVRGYDPILDEWYWELKEIRDPRWG